MMFERLLDLGTAVRARVCGVPEPRPTPDAAGHALSISQRRWRRVPSKLRRLKRRPLPLIISFSDAVPPEVHPQSGHPGEGRIAPNEPEPKPEIGRELRLMTAATGTTDQTSVDRPMRASTPGCAHVHGPARSSPSRAKVSARSSSDMSAGRDINRSLKMVGDQPVRRTYDHGKDAN